MDIIWVLLLGHILGDYFFQTHWMASNKWKPDGIVPCVIHCVVYTFTVCLCLWYSGIQNAYLPCLIFLSHFFIDRYSLASVYIRLKDGPDITNSFYPVIYVFVDNTSHMILMYGILKILGLI